MVPRRSKVFMDTCAIAGAYETGCLKAIAGAYKLESAEICITEATRRNFFGNKLVDCDPSELAKFIKSTPVEQALIDQMDFMLEGAQDVHEGEKALLALALQEKEPVWWICGPDGGTLRALNFLYTRYRNPSMDNMCALETLTKGIGMRKQFEKDYFKLSEEWLKMRRSKIIFGQ